jgi:hypothetical protein
LRFSGWISLPATRRLISGWVGTKTSYPTAPAASLATASSRVEKVLSWTSTSYFFSKDLRTASLTYSAQL